MMLTKFDCPIKRIFEGAKYFTWRMFLLTATTFLGHVVVLGLSHLSQFLRNVVRKTSSGRWYEEMIFLQCRQITFKLLYINKMFTMVSKHLIILFGLQTLPSPVNKDVLLRSNHQELRSVHASGHSGADGVSCCLDHSDPSDGDKRLPMRCCDDSEKMVIAWRYQNQPKFQVWYLWWLVYVGMS